MLVINDEQLAKKLQEIADREHRPVEELLAEMIEQYPPESSANALKSEAPKPDKSEAVKQARRKVYAMARRYWESVGDMAKAAMTDEELDKDFGAFDEEGIPRLRHELKSLDPPPGSLAYAAMIAERGTFRSGKPDLARRSEEILDEYYADELASRMRGEDASKKNPR
jgi:hypothetical protein